MELVAQVAETGGVTAAEAKRMVDLVLGEVEAGIARADGKYAIAGFGTFVVTMRAARRGRNPRSGAIIDIPASKALKFKPAPSLKAAAGCS